MADRFSDVEQVADSVVRVTRKSGDSPFAVYYIDISEQLPTTPEALTRYQDRVIGKHYFEGRKSLQWNNYLYFVVSEEQSRSGALRQAKDLIEGDRAYARKFIVAERDLDAAIQLPPLLATSSPQPAANILSVWTAKLAEAGIDGAIMSDASVPSRLSRIESSAQVATPKKVSPAQPIVSGALPFLRSIELTKFRSCPIQRTFDFGRVNLIVGVNGSGKTSLLEAIELLYCGRNKRNPDVTDDYTLRAEYTNGSNEVATRARAQKLFRDRNLSWYGQAEVKTNNLFISFGQFNFLDTDAAVGISESTAPLEEDLSKLLIGPQASKIWREIERMHDAITAKLKELRPLKMQISEEMETIETRLKEAGTVKQKSDSILTRLEEMVKRLGWDLPTQYKEAYIGRLVETLTELGALARQAVALDHVASPVSLDGLKQFSDHTKKLCDKTDGDILRLEEFRKEQRRLTDIQRRCQESKKAATDLARMVDAGVPTREAELRSQQSVAITQSGRLAGLDEKMLLTIGEGQGDIAVAEFVSTVSTRRVAIQKALAHAKEEHEKFTALRDLSLKLAQQLRDIASQVIQRSSRQNECPLCHTQFGPGELSRRIQIGVDEHIEARAQEQLTQIREYEEELRAAADSERAAIWLSQFCERASLAATTSLKTVLAQIESGKIVFEAALRRSEELKKESLTYASQGLSSASLNECVDYLHTAGHSVSDLKKQTVDRLLVTLDQELSKAASNVDAHRTEADTLQRVIEESLGIVESDLLGLRKALSQVRELRVIADSLLEKLSHLFKTLPWQNDRPFSDLVVEADSVREVAAEFQSAIEHERQSKAVFAESDKRKAILKKQLAELNPRIERFAQALKTLEIIRTKHSLAGAMKSALTENRAGIEAIFCRIHAPVEFSGLGKKITTLVRNNGGNEVNLSEISTGQRAAFALSIFLAQNLQLRAAPPLMLIDDPIAHIDDLNSLSFLDYLREIALAGSRQILFATANEKLATLFQRKFDFLGDDQFRRFDLRR
jgi:recombinational DNA repair ATPase RecF